jgi:hypothetical protein
MSDTSIALVLSRLKGVRQTPAGWVALCPTHEDRRPSLAIAKCSDGTVVIECHAGCNPSAVVAALGLTMRDLFPVSEAFSTAKAIEIPSGRPRQADR